MDPIHGTSDQSTNSTASITPEHPPAHHCPDPATDMPLRGDGGVDTLDRLLGLLHDSGDQAAIRLCDELGLPVDPANRGRMSLTEAAARTRTLAQAASAHLS